MIFLLESNGTVRAQCKSCKDSKTWPGRVIVQGVKFVPGDESLAAGMSTRTAHDGSLPATRFTIPRSRNS